MTRTRVIAIMALPHSGSHLLSQLLGAHSDCLSIGELHNYDKLTNRDRQGSGNVISSYAEDPLFQALDKLPVERWHAEVLTRARTETPTLTTLVDNSKRVAWCASLLRNPDLDVYPVHLIRDPRALLRYWTLRYDNAKKVRRQRIQHSRVALSQAFRLLTCPTHELYLRKWLIRNQEATELLSRAGKRTSYVTYHDLASQPGQTLQRLMPLLGLDYEPDQLRYGEADHRGTVKAEYQRASEASAINLDTRWQTDLSAEGARTATEYAPLNRYLESLSLEFSANGLTLLESTTARTSR